MFRPWLRYETSVSQQSEKYATIGQDSMRGANNQALNSASEVIKGCKTDHIVKNFYIDSSQTTGDFIPIKVEGSASYVVRSTLAIRDIETRTETIWQVKGGVATLTAPVLAGSGYRLYYNWVSEDDTEAFPIRSFVDSVNVSPDPNEEDTFGVSLTDFDENDKPFTVSENVTSSGTMSKTPIGRIKSGFIDFRMPAISNSLSVYFDSNDLNAGDKDDFNYTPSTVRLVSVSGCLLPITSKTETKTTTETKNVLVGWKKRYRGSTRKSRYYTRKVPSYQDRRFKVLRQRR